MYTCICNTKFITSEDCRKHTAYCKSFSEYCYKTFPKNSQEKFRKSLRDQLTRSKLYDDNLKDNYDYIICPYCTHIGWPDRTKMLMEKHFFLHSKTVEEVLKEYPNLLWKRKKSQELLENTNLEIYKVKNQGQREEVKDTSRNRPPEEWQRIELKKKETNIKKYKVENTFQLEKVKEGNRNRSQEFYDERTLVSREAFQKNWGEDHYTKTEKGKKILKESFEQKYGEGITNPTYIPGVKEKQIETNRKNHGGLYNSQTSEWKMRIQEIWKNRTLEERDKIKESTEKTNLEVWGFLNPSQSPIIKEKIRNILLERTGSEIAIAYNYSLAGYRPDIGFICRSTWEANYMRYLQYIGVPYQYEPKLFSLAIKEDTTIENRSKEQVTYRKGDKLDYLPDLFTDHFIEIKGILDPLSNLKITLFKEQYPQEALNFELIQEKEYFLIKDAVKNKILYWESSKFNIKTHPKEFGLISDTDSLDLSVYCLKNYEESTEENKLKLIQDVCNHYQKKGFPYSKEDTTRFLNELDTLKKTNLIVKDKEILEPDFNQSYLFYFFPLLWDISEWNDLKFMDTLITNRFKYSRFISDEHIRLGLNFFNKVKEPIHPAIFKYLIQNYIKENMVVFDPLCKEGQSLISSILIEKVKQFITIQDNQNLINLKNWLILNKLTAPDKIKIKLPFEDSEFDLLITTIENEEDYLVAKDWINPQKTSILISKIELEFEVSYIFGDCFVYII